MKQFKSNSLFVILFITFNLIMSSATNVYAYDEKGVYFVTGNQSCGQFTEDIKKGDAWVNMYDAYLQGFIASINATVPGKANFFEGTDEASRFQFVTKYCQENPLSSVIAGITELVKKVTGKSLQHLMPQPVQKPKPLK